MKLRYVIAVVLVMSILGCAALCGLLKHRVVESELSEVYQRYKDRDDLRVGFVKDYRIDDSTVVDVTTLTAKDSASWEKLLREMNISEILIDILRKSYIKGNQSVNHYYCVKGHPEQSTSIDYPEVDIVIYVQHLIKGDRTFYVFDLRNKKQGRTILYHKSNEIQTSKKQ